MSTRFPICSGILLTCMMLIVGCAEKVDSPAEFIAVARKHERDSKFPEAAAAYKQALSLDAQNPTAWYDLGVAYATMEQFPEAIDAYSKAIELDNGMAEAFNNRAAAYARLKQFDQAIADCDRAVALNRDDALAWRNRGLARHDHGDLDAALNDYDESIRINGRSAETYHYRGNVFLDRKQWSRALEDFDQAIHLDSNMAAAWLSRTITLARMGRADEAEQSRAKAQKLGSAVEDVVVASLLPEESAADVEDEPHKRAVSFVQSELKNKQQLDLALADAPWDLMAKSGDSEPRFLVRLLNNESKDSCITFSANVIEQIQQQAKATTLIIVREIDAAEVQGITNGSPSGFKIVNRIENWTPDIARMQPAVWSLPLASAAADAEPAVSAASNPD